MRALHRIVLVGFLALCSACTSGPSQYLQQYQSLYRGRTPTPSDFFTCYDFECKSIARVSLSPEEWSLARAPLLAAAPDPRSERQQIARAVLVMEGLTGLRMAATEEQRRAFYGGDSAQLDCIDDSLNTWVYLTLLERDGLLMHHVVGSIVHGGSVLDLDVRNSASLVVTATGERFAIDPTQARNGGPPPIFPLELWAGDWPPDLAAAGWE